MKIYLFHTKNVLKTLNFILILLISYVFISFENEVITTLKDFRTIYEGKQNEKAVAISINVDWGEEYIPLLLETLQKENVKATFFITGRWAKLFPQHVKAIADAGHEIGNHGYYHKHHEQISFEHSLKEIRDTEAIIYSITKKRTVLFAPPYGEKGEAVIKSAFAAGYRTVYWTVDTIDWRRPPSYEIVKRIRKIGLSNGAIIMMHPTKPTTEALHEIIKLIKNNGYVVKTVSHIAGGY